MLINTIPSSKEWKQWVNTISSDPRGAIPPGALHYKALPADQDESGVDYLEDPVTYSRIYPENSLQVVYNVVAASAAPEEVTSALFSVNHSRHEEVNSYVCSVLLVAALGGATIEGSICHTLAEARRSACMATCKYLLDRNLLDYRLFPYLSNKTFQVPQLVAPKVNVNARNCYLRKDPGFWQSCLSISSSSGARFPKSSTLR